MGVVYTPVILNGGDALQRGVGECASTESKAGTCGTAATSSVDFVIIVGRGNSTAGRDGLRRRERS